jgi:hypothetical protein
MGLFENYDNHNNLCEHWGIQLENSLLAIYVLHFKYKKVSHDVVHGMIDHFSNSSQKMKILKIISWMSIDFAQREETMQSIHGFWV